MEREETTDQAAQHTPTFDADAFLAATSESELEQLQRQLQAKESQIQSRTQLHDETVTRLTGDIRDVERELDRHIRTSEKRPRLEARRDSLRDELRTEKRRFAAELRELEDQKLELEAELAELVEAQVLIAGLTGDPDIETDVDYVLESYRS